MLAHSIATNDAISSTDINMILSTDHDDDPKEAVLYLLDRFAQIIASGDMVAYEALLSECKSRTMFAGDIARHVDSLCFASLSTNMD